MDIRKYVGFIEAQRIVTLIILGAMFAMSVACSSKEAANEAAVNKRFDTIYQNMNLVHASPDYPGHIDAFNYCAKASEEGCYRVIEHVKESVSALKELAREDALKNIINTIKKYCYVTTSMRDPNEQLCEGALTSIYLFNEKEDDEQLLSAFKKLSKEKNTRIFHGNKEWYYNRIDSTPWKHHVRSVLEGVDLELQIWRFNQKDVKPFGLMYMESPVPSGDNLTY